LSDFSIEKVWRFLKFIPGFEHSSEMTGTAREVSIDGALTYDKAGKIS
jgi:hypothetical protein